MNMNSTHPEYETSSTSCLRAGEVFASEEAVKAACTRYLPRLDSQAEDELSLALRSRPIYYSPVRRTAGRGGLAGKNTADRGRSSRGLRTEFAGSGCGGFQSLLWAFPGGRGCKPDACKRVLAETCNH
jgi:hypothetical protein